MNALRLDNAHATTTFGLGLQEVVWVQGSIVRAWDLEGPCTVTPEL